MKRATRIRFAALLAALATLACSDDPARPPGKQLATLAVAPATATLQVGDTLRIGALPRAADGTVLEDVSIAWAAEQEDVVAVSGSGRGVLLRALEPGNSKVTASAQGLAATMLVTVAAVPAPVATVEVHPATAQLPVGQQLELAAVLKDASGGVLGYRPVTWSIAGQGGALQPHPHPLKVILAAQGPGAVTVRASSQGVQGEALITLAAVAQPPAGIVFEPAVRGVLLGDSLELHAELRTAAGDVAIGYPITWASSNPGVLRIEALAQNGSAKVYGVAAGVAVISAAGAGFQRNVVFTVTAPPPPPAPVGYVLVQPARFGMWEYQVKQLTARTLASNGLELPDRHVSWSAEDLQLVQVDAAGVVRAGSTPGTTRIYADSEGKRGVARVHVYRITPRMDFRLTFDWWDGQVHVVAPVATAEWTNPQGQVLTLDLFPESGTFRIDRDLGRYESVLRVVGYAQVGTAWQKVVERELRDSGTMVYRWQPYTDGASTFDFYSATMANRHFTGRLRAPGELQVALPTGSGEIRDLLFRLD